MKKEFNITGACNPDRHYMVNLESRLKQIKNLIDNESYFTINKGRQYGKTTTLKALRKYLSTDYIVISLDFQGNMSSRSFSDENIFAKAFVNAVKRALKGTQYFSDLKVQLKAIEKNVEKQENDFDLVALFESLSDLCANATKPIVMMIDEVDQATNNQVFLDFLSQLRYYYIERDERPTFQSVILAGVHDIRNLKQKISKSNESGHNSPWNIAVPFDVDMSFSAEDITGMLSEYEIDYQTGMNLLEISQLIYEYTSGYPVLVSSLCKLIDEKVSGTEMFSTKSQAWTKAGLLRAVKLLLNEKTPLFDSLIDKLRDNQKLKDLLYYLLFTGKSISYNIDNDVIDISIMYGFIKDNHGKLTISNRIFETRIYDWFMSEEETNGNDFYSKDKSQFIQQGKLNMDLVLEKFISHFNDVYGSKDNKFKEEVGRRLFLLYLKPIINGTGTYYIEAQTRDERRMDVVVNYAGEEFIIELKIWHGEQYNSNGEQQLSDYLDYKNHKKGYLLTFNFNQSKEVTMKQVKFGDKILIEAFA